MHDERFQLVMSEDDRKALNELAAMMGVSLSGVLRQLLRREARYRGLMDARGRFVEYVTEPVREAIGS